MIPFFRLKVKTISIEMSDQSDSQDKHRREEPVNPNLGDWSPDYFPTSPMTVFKRSLILLLGVGILCFAVAYCSREDEAIKAPSENSNPENISNGVKEDDIF